MERRDLYSFPQNSIQLWPGFPEGSYARAAPVRVMLVRVSGGVHWDNRGILWQQHLTARFESSSTRERERPCQQQHQCPMAMMLMPMQAAAPYGRITVGSARWCRAPSHGPICTAGFGSGYPWVSLEQKNRKRTHAFWSLKKLFEVRVRHHLRAGDWCGSWWYHNSR